MNCVDVGGQIHTLAVLLPGKEALVPTDRRFGGCEPVWTSLKRKTSCCCNKLNPDSFVTIRKMCVGLSLSLSIGFVMTYLGSTDGLLLGLSTI